jgi:hypothetical protein
VKPYIAVLYDSFLESISSRVLWILLAAWLLILGALFPLSISEGETYLVSTSDIESPRVVMDQLALASTGKGTRAQRAIYAKLPEDFQQALKERQKSGRRIFVGRLVSALNTALEAQDLYDKQAWPTAERREELKELIANENKSPEELQRFNRRLLDLTFPNSINSSVGQATWITYAGMKFTEPFPITARQIRPFIEAGLIPTVLWLGLGIVAMMVAIVITSSMIPDMFQTGSLHLLLSKPLSRNLLYLSKYLGGCIFVSMNIAFLVIGLYLYCGIQLQIWNSGILWCIPLFIFYFMIFYSVSALAGLVWKNPIICVVVTAMFWAVCFTLGFVRDLTQAFLQGPPTVQHIHVVGDTPVVGNQQGRIQFWNEDTSTWQTGYGDVDGQRVVGPVYLPKTGNLYFGRAGFAPFGIRGNNATRLEMARLPELSGADAAESEEASSFSSKKWWDDIRLDSGPDLPANTTEIIPWQDSFAAVSTDGIYRFDSEAASNAEKSKVSLFGFDMKIPQADEPYKRMTGADAEYRRPMSFANSNDYQLAVIYTRGKLIKLKGEGGRLINDGELSFEFPPETFASIAVQEGTAFVCPKGFTPLVIDLQSMKIAQKLEAIGEGTIKRIATDRRGRVAILGTNGDIWIVSRDAGQTEWSVTKPNLPGQGDAVTIAFDSKDRLWLSHAVKNVDAWSSDLTASEKTYRPRSTIPEQIFSYIINPLYMVFPKPSAINQTIQYAMKNPDSKLPAMNTADLDIPQIELDPWQPIWSNALFITVMLSLGCWHLYRQDL